MEAYTKHFLKAGSQFYLASLLNKMAKENEKRRMMELENENNNMPQDNNGPRMEFHFYESSVIRIMGVISSFIEVSLKNGIEVDPFLMNESQDIMNSLQELMDAKRKNNNGN